MQTFKAVPANVTVHVQLSALHRRYLGLVFVDGQHVASTLLPRALTMGGRQRCNGDVMALAQLVGAA